MKLLWLKGRLDRVKMVTLGKGDEGWGKVKGGGLSQEMK